MAPAKKKPAKSKPKAAAAKARAPRRARRPGPPKPPEAAAAVAARAETPASSPPPPPDPNAWRLVNRQQIAELLGAHPDTVSDYTKDGMPVAERGGHGRESVYDAVACLTWWRQQQGKGAKEVAQTRSFNAQADLAEQRLRVQRNDLRSRAAIVMAGQSIMKGWSVRLQSIPRRLVQLGVLSRENEHVAMTLIKAILTDIARWRVLEDVEAPGQEEDVA